MFGLKPVAADLLRRLVAKRCCRSGSQYLTNQPQL